VCVCVCVCVFVLFLVCLVVFVHLSPLISLRFFILFYYCELVNAKLHKDQGQKHHTYTNLKHPQNKIKPRERKQVSETTNSLSRT
jgi:hypothetical protein